MIEEDRRYRIKSEKDMESKAGRALRQTSFISILLRCSPDSNVRGKTNKYSVTKFGHHVFISATSYRVLCCVQGTRDSRSIGKRSSPLRPPDRHESHGHKLA